MHTAITIDALKVLDAIDRKGSFAGAAEDLAHSTRQVAEGWETRLRIGFNSLMPADCLFPAIEAFYQLGVPVDVQIVEEVFAGAWDALQSRRVDMIVGADQLSKPAGSFTTKALGEVPFVFAVAANHPLANAKEPLAEADIAPYPAAVAADTSRSLPPGHAGIFRRQRTLTVSNIDQKIAVQEAGLGVGWLPVPRIREQLARGSLVAREVHEPRPAIAIHLARHSEDKGKA